MDRLTHSYLHGGYWASIFKVSACGEDECRGGIIDRLAAYENAEEQGLLVRLPCRVGDIVYTNIKFYGSYWREKDKPYSAEIVFVGLNGDVATGGGFINVAYLTGHMLQFNFCDIGKTIFLTHEAAEKALKERSVENGAKRTD